MAELPASVRGTALDLRSLGSDAAPRWSLAEVAGRLVEISGARADATLSIAFSLVRDAQQRGEPVAWVGGRASGFFPPDVAAAGVDLAALALVRVPRAGDVAVAADWLARSGAFGLIVLDLYANALVPMPLQARLLSLAQKHDLGVLFLTERVHGAHSSNTLVSLRGEASLRRIAPQRFECELAIIKDKRRSTLWRHAEVHRGPPGLR